MEVDKSLISVSIRTSRRSKRLRLVYSMSGAEIVAPATSTLNEINDFLTHHKSWLVKAFRHYEKLIERCGRYESDSLYYLGEKFKFSVVKDRQDGVTVSASMKLVTFHVRDLRNAKKAITEWYKSETTRIVNSRLPVIAASHGLNYNRISIKNMRSRWGSCSRKKNLNFSLLLSAAPPRVAEYVMIHELMHLVQLDHSAKFWRLVESADPDYKKSRAWLVDYAPVIKVG